jgi:hypothetical protein
LIDSGSATIGFVSLSLGNLFDRSTPEDLALGDLGLPVFELLLAAVDGRCNAVLGRERGGLLIEDPGRLDPEA